MYDVCRVYRLQLSEECCCRHFLRELLCIGHHVVSLSCSLLGVNYTAAVVSIQDSIIVLTISFRKNELQVVQKKNHTSHHHNNNIAAAAEFAAAYIYIYNIFVLVQTTLFIIHSWGVRCPLTNVLQQPHNIIT